MRDNSAKLTLFIGKIVKFCNNANKNSKAKK